MDGLKSPRLRSSEPAVDIDGFFDIVGDAVKAELDLAKVPDDKRPLYLEDWPKERLAQPNAPFDFIGYHVVFSRRASSSNSSYRAAKGLTLFDQKPSPHNAGYIQYTYGWTEEAIVNFTMLASSNARARDLMKFFQNVILKYTLTGYFKEHGINYLVFHRRLEDTIEKAENQELYTRRLQYVVRVQNLMTFEAKSLDSLQVNVGMTEGGEISSFSLPPE